MGSGESKNESLNEQQIREQARAKAFHEELQRKKAQLEEEKVQWQQQQIREQHWKESQLREEQKRKEAILEWQRQADLRTLKLQQEKMQRELEEQKKLQQLMKEKFKIELEKENLRNAQFEKDPLLLQQVSTTTSPSAPPLTSSGMREMIAMQQKTPAGPSTNISPLIVPNETLAKLQTVSRGSAANPASSIVKKKVPAQQKASASSFASCSSSTATRATADVQQKVSPAPQIVKNSPKSKEAQKSYLSRMKEANVTYDEWLITDYIKDGNSISKQVSTNLMKLFNDNKTIPFIARYRRDLTNGMNEDKLRAARHNYDQAKLIKRRAEAIVEDIDDKGLWTPEFHALVHETKSLHDLEYINSIFTTPKSNIIKTAILNGLGIVADACLKNKTPQLANLVRQTVEGLRTEEQVKNGIVHLLADIIIKDKGTFNFINKVRPLYPCTIQTAKGGKTNILKKQDHIYEPYYNFTLSERDLNPNQVRDINRGEALKVLSVKIHIPVEFELEFKQQCLQQYGFMGYVPSLNKTLMDTAINFAYNRSIKSFVAKRVRKEISDKAKSADSVRMAQELKEYLLLPPVRGKRVIGISPGFENGCKFAAVSEQGDVLETGTIYPNNANNLRGKSEAERVLANLICQQKCTIIALGNGDASKETEVFLTTMIKKNKKIPSDVFYTVVDKWNALIYGCSRETSLEFPGVETEMLCAVSIARRLQDPMAEVVKINPEHLASEKYQQEMYRQLLVELVSYVGVDVNTASVSLLKNVAGLNEVKANSIIEWRRSYGPFINKSDLCKVTGINKSTFEQCAGFIRIVPETAVAIGGQAVAKDSFNYLDQTWIHPESYDIAQSFLETAKCNVLQLGTSSFIFSVNLYAQIGYAELAKKFGTTKETMEIIVAGLRIGKGQDIRGREDSTMFRKSLIRFNDLNTGDLLYGVVTHLATFGAFVDVGAEVDGLIHESCMNGLTVKADQKVEVRVRHIQKERGRLGLTLMQCR